MTDITRQDREAAGEIGWLLKKPELRTPQASRQIEEIIARHTRDGELRKALREVAQDWQDLGIVESGTIEKIQRLLADLDAEEGGEGVGAD